MVPVRSKNNNPYELHPVSQKFPQRCLWNGSNVRLIDDGPLSSSQGRSSSASFFNDFFLQAIDGVMSLALCQRVVSQAPQHLRSSEKQVTCEGCTACQCICSVISLHSSQCEEYEKVLKRKEKKYTDFCLNSLTNFQPSSFYLLSLSIIDGKCSLRKHTKPNH